MATITKELIDATRHLSSRQAAKALGVGKSTINDARKRFDSFEPELPKARVLIIDIESKPMQAYIWDAKTVYVSSDKIIDHGGMLCFAAKWLGDSEVEFYSDWQDGHDAMVQAAYRLLMEADIVITYNGDRYDIKRLNNEFLRAGMAPPSPYRSIDLFKTNRARFDLPYKKLDYLAQTIGVGQKVSHTGFQLWVDVMNGDTEAQALMREYNIGDVVLTEKTYIKLLPWLASVPHMGMFTVEQGLCPYCASDSVHGTGETYTYVQRYQLFKCDNCEGWSRGNKPVGEVLTTRRVV